MNKRDDKTCVTWAIIGIVVTLFLLMIYPLIKAKGML